METSLVTAKCVRTSMSSQTPWACMPSHHYDDRHVPSTIMTAPATQIMLISVLNISSHTPPNRRFAILSREYPHGPMKCVIG